GLALALNSMTLTYSNSQLSLSGVSSSTEIIEQSLPFNLKIGGPVQVQFLLGTLTGVTNNGTRLTGFTGSGTGTVTGTALPEPATLLLLSTGLPGGCRPPRR